MHDKNGAVFIVATTVACKSILLAAKSIEGILNCIESTGCTCDLKTYSKSDNLKKRLPHDPKKIVFIPDSQEATILQEQWDLVQDLRKQRHRIGKTFNSF